MMRRSVFAMDFAAGLTALLLVVLVATTSSATSEEFVEDPGLLRVTIAGRTARLEALIVKSAHATGRLPVALITHGKPANLQNMLDDRAAAYLRQAKGLAARGWLAVVVIRRGFGQSDGPMPVSLSCRSTTFLERFSAD